MRHALSGLPETPETRFNSNVKRSNPDRPMNLCMRCGACCACFRVAFPREEANDNPNGVVPLEYTRVSGQNKLVMEGTDGRNPRCIALEGFVGSSVRCTIYDRRPSTCRAFVGAWESNTTNPVCNNARVRFGLSPFDLF